MRAAREDSTNGVRGFDGGLLAAAATVAALAACATAPPVPPRPPAELPPPVAAVESGPSEALEAFLAAAEAGDFQRAYQLLAVRLRERYTPARLESDFRAVEGAARDRLARARAALAAPPRIEGEHAAFAISDRRSVRMVREPGGWRIEALE